MELRTCLKWRDVSRKELISSDVILSKIRTSIRISQTDPYLQPIPGISNVISKPLGKLIKPVLPVGPTGHGVASVRLGHGESEDKHHKQKNYEGGHTEEVESKKALFVEVSADEAGEGDEEDEDAEDEDRPPEQVDALIVGLGGQPYAGGHYGDGAHEGHEVEECGYFVAHSHGGKVKVGGEEGLCLLCFVLALFWCEGT